MKVFLVRWNNADSWTGIGSTYSRVFSTKKRAREFIGEVASYWRDNDKEIEPYYTILEVNVEG